MVISDKYKYVFIQIPRTGSTAISKELRENYDGRLILHKHANYHLLLKQDGSKYKNYFIFAAVRDPLDDAVSSYSKLLTDHSSNYTDKTKHIDKGGWVSKKRLDIYNFVQSNRDFGKFLKRFYHLPYTSNINVNKKYCDFILRFENLDKDFSKALQEIGIKKKRPLPLINQTKRDKGLSGYYTNESMRYAARVFGPFMREWGYDFPKNWSGGKTPLIYIIAYKCVKVGRTIYSKYVQEGPLRKATFIRNMFE